MTDSVFIKKYPAPQIDLGEILRYAGCKSEDGCVKTLANECITLAKDKLSYCVCYTFASVRRVGDEVDLGFTTVKSHNLSTYLSDCDSVLIFAATIGFEIDRLIKSRSIIEPSKAVMLQALGAERCESLCNLFCEDIKPQGVLFKTRVSPGYGDIPLELQKDIFRLLNPQKIGITLNESLLMSPSKSVTAIVGINNRS